MDSIVDSDIAKVRWLRSVMCGGEMVGKTLYGDWRFDLWLRDIDLLL